MLGFDACLQGQRSPGSGNSSETQLYQMMLTNPVVIRESVRQTVNDMVVLYDLLNRGKIVLPPMTNHADLSGGQNVTFDAQYGLYMGHSQGSQEAGLLLGITDHVKNAFLSAGGGGVALSFVSLALEGLPDMLKGKTIAQILEIPFNLKPGDISVDSFLTTQIVQPLMDPIDPLNFTTRFIKEPPPGMHPKNIAQTMGLNDRSTPHITQQAMAVSEGLPVVGKLFDASDAMKLAGLDSPVPSPVSNNLSINVDGTKTTGGIMQFDYKGNSNPHFVIYYMQAAKRAYVDFFQSVIDGHPTIKVDASKQSGIY